MPASLVAAACSLLDEDDRLAASHATSRRARLLEGMRAVLDAWTLGKLSAEQAATALRALRVES